MQASLAHVGVTALRCVGRRACVRQFTGLSVSGLASLAPFGDWKQRWRPQVELGLFYLFSRHSHALLCVFQSVVTFPHLQDFYVFLTN